MKYCENIASYYYSYLANLDSKTMKTKNKKVPPPIDWEREFPHIAALDATIEGMPEEIWKHLTVRDVIHTQAFADNLIHALVGKPLHNQNLVRQLATGIQNTIDSAGTSTVRFHETIDATKKAMRGLGVSESQAQVLAAELKAIGDKVRGPEDIPLTSVT